jgi:hypothetical protein
LRAEKPLSAGSASQIQNIATGYILSIGIFHALHFYVLEPALNSIGYGIGKLVGGFPFAIVND